MVRNETHEQRSPLLLYCFRPYPSFLSFFNYKPPPSNLFLLYDPIAAETTKKIYPYSSFNFSLFYYFPPNLFAEAKNTSQTLIRSPPLPRFSPVSLRSPRSIAFFARI